MCGGVTQMWWAVFAMFSLIHIIGATMGVLLLVISAKKLTFDAIWFSFTWPIYLLLIIPLAWIVRIFDGSTR